MLALCLFASATCRAEEPAVPREAETAEVSAQLVQQADIIVRVTVTEVLPVEGGVTLKGMVDRLKGPKSRAERPIFVPAARGQSFVKHDDYRLNNYILFAKNDLTNERSTLLDDKGAVRRGFTPLAQKILEIVQQQSGVEIEMSSDKPVYQPAEPIILIWKFKNISDHAVRVNTSREALQYSYAIDNGSTGTGTSNSTPALDDFKVLAPDATLEERKTITDAAREGEVRIEMVYEASDNIARERVGMKQEFKRVDDAVLTRVEKKFVVRVAPLAATSQQTNLEKLNSPVWAVQRDAMKALALDEKSAALPAVQAMSTHPWPQIRVLAAQALSLSNTRFTPALRDLLFDPNSRVRSETRDLLGRRNIEGSSLSLLALLLTSREALQRGFLEDAHYRLGEENILYNLSDARLGDVWAELLRKDQADGKTLAREVGLFREIFSHETGWHPTSEQKQKILDAWQAQRDKVKDKWTMADLEAEKNYLRRRAFNDFQFHPQFVQIRELMKKLNKDFYSYGRPEDEKTLAAFGPESAPTVMWILQNSYNGYDSRSLFRLLRQWKAAGAGQYLAAEAYDFRRAPDEPDSDIALYAPLEAAALNRALAYPQIEYLFPASSGAALALGALGEKRAVPVIMQFLGKRASLWTDEQQEILARLTGQNFPDAAAWKKWWQQQGAQQEWE
jgi:HEAT repeat protein